MDLGAFSTSPGEAHLSIQAKPELNLGQGYMLRKSQTATAKLSFQKQRVFYFQCLSWDVVLLAKNIPEKFSYSFSHLLKSIIPEKLLY